MLDSSHEPSALSNWLNSVPPDRIFCAVVSFFWLIYLWETYLSWRQHRLMLNSAEIPDSVAPLIDPGAYNESRQFGIECSRLAMMRGLWSQLLFTGTLTVSIVLKLWAAAGQHLTAVTGWQSGDCELSQSVVFLAYVMILGCIVDLPWSVYKTFVIEARHGFNKQTPAFFAWNQVKTLAAAMALELPATAAILRLIGWGGRHFYLCAWALASAGVLAKLWIFPRFIAPLFDRSEPLMEGDLKRRIEELCARLKLRVPQLKVANGPGRRVAHSSACLTGFWRCRRIVLFDSLIPSSYNRTGREVAEGEREKAAEDKGCNDDEILAVLGHELGHWSLGHNVSNILISEVNLFLMFFAFGQFVNCHSVFAAFGFAPPAPLLLRLTFVLEFLLSPYNELLGFAMICLTRRFEFQADAFSVRLGFGRQLKTALMKLEKDNLSFPLFDPLYSAFNHSHPPLLHRIDAIDAADRKSE